MQCPVCGQGVYDKNAIKVVSREKGLGQQPLCTVSSHGGQTRLYRPFDQQDIQAFERAKVVCEELRRKKIDGLSVIPDERVSRDYEWVLKPPMFGLDTWGDQHNPRQLLSLSTFSTCIASVSKHLSGEYGNAVVAILTLALGRVWRTVQPNSAVGMSQERNWKVSLEDKRSPCLGTMLKSTL